MRANLGSTCSRIPSTIAVNFTRVLKGPGLEVASNLAAGWLLRPDILLWGGRDAWLTPCCPRSLAMVGDRVGSIPVGVGNAGLIDRFFKRTG